MSPAPRLLAVDFDRTLTRHPFGVHPDVPDAIRRARAAGIRVAVCSGQPVAHLLGALPPLDAVAGENGSVVWLPGEERPWVHPWAQRSEVVAILDAAAIPHTSFDVIFDVSRTHEERLRTLLRPELHARAVANVDRMNIEPFDATKGTGLKRIQEALGVPPERTIAVGDGENDVALFAQAGLALAVADATEPAKRAAHRVLSRPDGEGVCAVIEELLGQVRAA